LAGNAGLLRSAEGPLRAGSRVAKHHQSALREASRKALDGSAHAPRNPVSLPSVKRMEGQTNALA